MTHAFARSGVCTSQCGLLVIEHAYSLKQWCCTPGPQAKASSTIIWSVELPIDPWPCMLAWACRMMQGWAGVVWGTGAWSQHVAPGGSGPIPCAQDCEDTARSPGAWSQHEALLSAAGTWEGNWAYHLCSKERWELLVQAAEWELPLKALPTINACSPIIKLSSGHSRMTMCLCWPITEETAVIYTVP